VRDYYKDHFSYVARKFTRSEIRELLKLVGAEGFISFAGGLPSPETFDKELIKKLADYVIDEYGDQAFQYSQTEGTPQLVQSLIDWAKTEDIHVGPKNVLVTTASQQGLYFLGKIFLDPGDKVICGIPTYLGAIQAFRTFQAELVGVPLDPETGIETEKIEDILKKERKKVKFIYTVPDFQNPSGVTLSLEKRKHLLEIADKYEILVVEDSPYRKLRYVGEEIPSLLTMDKGKERILTIYTFSKIFVPGFRLGWAIGPENIIDMMGIAKQGVDLCTPAFNQLIASEFINRGHLETQIKNNIKLYSRKQKVMLDAMERLMPKMEGLTWTKPKGGLFLWFSMPPGYDTKAMFPKAIEKKVAYVVGTAFDCTGGSKNCARINFSFPPENLLAVGVERLAEVVKAEVMAEKV
jgi:2-aminoadipate transaminase